MTKSMNIIRALDQFSFRLTDLSAKMRRRAQRMESKAAMTSMAEHE
jgi:hypothetical protein